MSKTSAVAAKASTSSHFELFGLPAAFALDVGRLEAAYRDIQARVHPDKFAHAGDAERRASMQMTTRVNEAYRALKDPLRRAIHLLELNGVDVAFETADPRAQEFLIEQMEIRERLEESKSAPDLDLIQKSLSQQKSAMEKQIATEIDSKKNYENARTLVRKLMFFDRLAEEVDAAYDTLES